MSYSLIEPYFRKGNQEPPPNYVIGVGMRLGVGDMDGDGRQDVVVACRTGLYVFFNKGYSPRLRTRQESFLPGREAYPGNTPFGGGAPAGKKQ